MAEKKFDDYLLRLRQTDNVAVAKRMLRAGTELINGSIQVTAAKDIPPGHKISLSEIPSGEPVRKYGQVIGFANERIAPGDHVHTHNLAMKDFGRDYQFCADARPVNYYPAEQMR